MLGGWDLLLFIHQQNKHNKIKIKKNQCPYLFFLYHLKIKFKYMTKFMYLKTIHCRRKKTVKFS